MMQYKIYLLYLLVVSAAGQLNDEMQVYEEQCLGEDRFHCVSGECVAREQQCDGTKDCVDGSDEVACLHHDTSPVICDDTHQFLCEDGSQCIPTTWMCNNVSECADNSDEANCGEPTAISETAGNTTCKGFQCDFGKNTKCISLAWVCDTVYDCEDRTDEMPHNCRRTLANSYERTDCETFGTLNPQGYMCLDKSYCFPKAIMCDGQPDCRDGSDEGDFCKDWKTMCKNFTCGKNSTCRETRFGPTCKCDNYSIYNYTTNSCVPVNMCEEPKPHCSQICYNGVGWFKCQCVDGFIANHEGIQAYCYAPEPEAMLFFSTMNDIRYLKVRSKQVVTVATGIKQGHGVSYDGTYLYWVETAQGHQSIVRARLENVQGTKQTLVALGLEDAGDVAIDFVGDHIYFGDSERGSIYVCKSDGAMCKTLDNTGAVHPKFVTLDPKNGTMFWADLRNHTPVIMMARMDGSEPRVLVDKLQNFPTGLAVDTPSGRLFYVDKVVVGVLISNGRTYTVFDETIHHPYAVSVFEDTVYFSDWATETIQRVDKIGTVLAGMDPLNRIYKLDQSVYGMHMYHPLLMKRDSNPCQSKECSHLCLIVTNTTARCACPDGYILEDNSTCILDSNYHPQYLVIGAGNKFTRIQVNTLGNPELAATEFDVGRVSAMAYDGKRDMLYIYDSRLRSLTSMFMSSFPTGITHTLHTFGFEEVVDMDFDPVSDTLYILDAGSGYLEVFSVFNYKKAVLRRFLEETPISLCVLHNYGKLLIALRRNSDDRIEIREYGLDGEGEQAVVFNNLKGPRILMKYIEAEDMVYISDDGNSIIEYMHPSGTGREIYVELSTSVMGLALTPTYVFWTDRRNTRLYWSVMHEARPKIRRFEFSIFPNNTHLHIQSVIPIPNPTFSHLCHSKNCTDVCVQSSSEAGFKCLCAPGTMNINGQCVDFMKCGSDQGYCHESNSCYNLSRRCDGKQDCFHNEDEEGCPTERPTLPTIRPEIKECLSDEKLCYGECINKNKICKDPALDFDLKRLKCDNTTQYECLKDKLCISRSLLCDGKYDCPDKSDEDNSLCTAHTCLSTEFRCQSGTCVMEKFRCDREPDCLDGSDEEGCTIMTCAAGYFTCKSGECIASKNVCDGVEDCVDESDELECEDPDDVAGNKETTENCKDWEHTCELNRSICLPHSVRCNHKVDCPGGTDEEGCMSWCFPSWYCSFGCLALKKVCDGLRHCPDGSDESPEACSRVNRTSTFYTSFFPIEECTDGYLCKNGQCMEWQQVCDGNNDCLDGSDEGENCSISCKEQCEQMCHPSPMGPVCRCKDGFRLQGKQCVDIDECEEMHVCAQGCYNVHGTYLCTCDRGYMLRPDRHSCKAERGYLSLYYATGSQVSTKASGHVTVAYTSNGTVNDIDVWIRNNSLYLTTEDKLVKVNADKSEIVATNIGRPTKVTVDWMTGNAYYIDQSERSPYIRVCNFRTRRCAKLIRLANNSSVPALTIDPASYKLFYCVTTATDSVVWSNSLSGRAPMDLASVNICSGLAVDPYRQKLYVAEYAPPSILQMNYDGNKRKEMHTNDPHLKAPHGLSIFEDYIYYLVLESDQLRRCLLFGPKKCEVYQSKALKAHEFVLHHENLQREDRHIDKCTNVVCDNICVNSDHGPECICQDGAITKNGSCPLIDKKYLPRFNGETQQEHYERSYSDVVLSCVVALLLLLLIILVTYSVNKKNEQNRTRFNRVQFSWRGRGGSVEEAPTVDVPDLQPLASMSPVQHEYSNPMEALSFMQQLRSTFSKKQRPVGTAGLKIEIPRLDEAVDTNTNSDTESDIDSGTNPSSKNP